MSNKRGERERDGEKLQKQFTSHVEEEREQVIFGIASPIGKRYLPSFLYVGILLKICYPVGKSERDV